MVRLTVALGLFAPVVCHAQETSAAAPPPPVAEAPAPPAAEAPAPPAVEAPAPPAVEAPAPPTAEAPKPPAVAGYEKGFFLRDAKGDFELKINTRLQTRYELERADGEAVANRFLIPRARLKLAGHAGAKDLRYTLQTDFGKGFASLKDGFVDAVIVAPDAVQIRAGQFKRPFSRQQMTSASDGAMADRAITDKAFGAGRDLGVVVGNRYDKAPPFEWVLGVFNGTGDKASLNAKNEFSNVPAKMKPAAVLRLAHNSPDADSYTEADLKGGDLRYGVGLSVLAEVDGDDDDKSAFRVGFDAIIKVAHFSVNGELFEERMGKAHAFDGAEQSAIGVLAQANWFAGGRYLPVVRFAMVAPEGDDNDSREMMAGLGLLFHGHTVKWQTEGGLLQTETAGGSTDDTTLFRTQLQIGF